MGIKQPTPENPFVIRIFRGLFLFEYISVKSLIFLDLVKIFNKANYLLTNLLDADGKLTAFPAKRKMKIYALLYLSDKFESSREYTEREVNDILLEWHTFADPATLRRELFDYRFLDRSPDGRSYRLGENPPTLEELGL